MVPSGTESASGGTVWCLVVLGQYKDQPTGTWWYWVSLGCHCMVLGGTGWYWLLPGGTASV